MTQVKTGSNVLRHDNYNTASSAATKTPTNPIDYLLIQNVDAANDASISFDAGSTFITLAHGSSLELYVSKLVSYQIKDANSGSHATMQCLYGSEA